MADLYASVPSPLGPALGCGTHVGDREVYNRLENYVDPAGLRTSLFRYQFVSRVREVADSQRSVSKMIQMETTPGTLVDPRFISLREAGRDGTYYVDIETWDVQRYPGWYRVPKGGIL